MTPRRLALEPQRSHRAQAREQAVEEEEAAAAAVVMVQPAASRQPHSPHLRSWPSK
jgi:hypothetical protein